MTSFDDNPNKKGGDDLQSNNCSNCKEGCILGKSVYCNLDGRFHPLYDNFKCKSFISK